MALRLVILWAFVAGGGNLSCARSAEAPAAAAAPADAPDDPTRPLPRYRSRRLRLSLPLPHGPRWRIDDHSRPELVATDTASASRVVVSVFNAGALVGRAQCEEIARSRKLVPEGDLRALEDMVTLTQGTFDTRIEVALGVGRAETPLAGYVMAFGGFLRKCYMFVYSTEVERASDESILAARLATARSRILGGLELDPFDTVARDSETGPSSDGPAR